eukprot:365830-Chlamydomonas_euryale.AAC.7
MSLHVGGGGVCQKRAAERHRAALTSASLPILPTTTRAVALKCSRRREEPSNVRTRVQALRSDERGDHAAGRRHQGEYHS